MYRPSSMTCTAITIKINVVILGAEPLTTVIVLVQSVKCPIKGLTLVQRAWQPLCDSLVQFV